MLQNGCIVGLKDTSTDFLNYLEKSNLALGQAISIQNINDFDKSIDILLGKSTTLTISYIVAQNIFIKKIAK